VHEWAESIPKYYHLGEMGKEYQRKMANPGSSGKQLLKHRHGNDAASKSVWTLSKAAQYLTIPSILFISY